MWCVGVFPRCALLFVHCAFRSELSVVSSAHFLLTFCQGLAREK